MVTAFTSDPTSRRCSSELFQESEPQPRSNGDLSLCSKDRFPRGLLSVPAQRDHKESGLCARGMNVGLKPGFDCLGLRRDVFEWPFFNAWLVTKTFLRKHYSKYLTKLAAAVPMRIEKDSSLSGKIFFTRQ